MSDQSSIVKPQRVHKPLSEVDEVRHGPGTAGVVQRIELPKSRLPELRVMKPIEVCECQQNQY